MVMLFYITLAKVGLVLCMDYIGRFLHGKNMNLSKTAMSEVLKRTDVIESQRMKLNLGLYVYSDNINLISRMSNLGFTIEWDNKNCCSFVTWEDYDAILKG